MGSVTNRFGLLLAVLALCLSSNGLAQERRPAPIWVVINEVMASNRETLADPSGRVRRLD